MGHNYETSKKIALRTIILLAIITVFEVGIALAGKGHLFGGALSMPWYIMNLLMICLSVYKAYKIVFEFMHMGYEVRGLALSVLLLMIQKPLNMYQSLLLRVLMHCWRGSLTCCLETQRGRFLVMLRLVISWV